MSRHSAAVPVVAVDGPGGSGKGTIAQRLAARRGWHLLDSGAIYRLLALAALDAGVALDDEPRLVALAGAVSMAFEPGTAGVRALLDGVAEDARLRTETCGEAASRLAALAGVREALLDKQRGFRRAPGLVADGRDMGTVVFPDALLKLYLTASAEERARRRYKQLLENGENANIDSLFRDIRARDQRDAEREASPLKPAADAVIVDTTDLGVTEVAERACGLLADRLESRGDG